MIGKKIVTSRPSLIRDCSKDDPIYKLGFVVGQKNSCHFPDSTQKATASSEKRESVTSEKGKQSSSQKPKGGSERKLIRFDFPPGASPEEIAKALNEMVKKYRKDK